MSEEDVKPGKAKSGKAGKVFVTLIVVVGALVWSLFNLSIVVFPHATAVMHKREPGLEATYVDFSNASNNFIAAAMMGRFIKEHYKGTVIAVGPGGVEFMDYRR